MNPPRQVHAQRHLAPRWRQPPLRGAGAPLSRQLALRRLGSGCLGAVVLHVGTGFREGSCEQVAQLLSTSTLGLIFPSITLLQDSISIHPPQERHKPTLLPFLLIHGVGRGSFAWACISFPAPAHRLRSSRTTKRAQQPRATLTYQPFLRLPSFRWITLPLFEIATPSRGPIGCRC